MSQKVWQKDYSLSLLFSRGWLVVDEGLRSFSDARETNRYTGRIQCQRCAEYVMCSKSIVEYCYFWKVELNERCYGQYADQFVRR